ncbi:Gfo/Idh/MocA family protein [Verrucomicrobiota bacterium]
MSDRLRVGIVGCGGIAHAHLGGYGGLADVEIAGVFDPDREAAERFAGKAGTSATASVEELIRKHSPDAVSICSPPSAHLENAVPFLEAGIPILCEKPLERNAATATALFREVKKRGTLFMTAYCHRFHPPIVELRSMIRAGTLGDPLLFRVIFTGFLDLATNHRGKLALSGGGCIMDNASHAVDIYRDLVGDPTHVQAFSATVVQDAEVDDFGLIHLSADERVFGEITVSYSLPVGAAAVEWYGSKGTAIIAYFDPAKPDLTYRREDDSEWTPVDCSNRPDRFAGEVSHFVDCVRRKETPLVTAADGLKASQVIAAAYESAAQGRRIAVDYGV